MILDKNDILVVGRNAVSYKALVTEVITLKNAGDAAINTIIEPGSVLTFVNGKWRDVPSSSIGGDDSVKSIAGTAPIVSSGDAGDYTISIAAATGATAGSMSAADFTKLSNIAANATVNSTDAQLRDRTTHTGAQLAATISNFSATSRAQTEAMLTAGTNITLTPSGTGADRSIQINAVAPPVGVFSVSGTAPIVSSGGSTPAISITAASGSTAGSMSSADFTKLSGIAVNATANATDAELRDRATHTGTQLTATISDFVSSSKAQIEATLIAGTNITLTPSGTGATLSIQIDATAGITAVTGTAPITSTGGSSPAIGIVPASSTVAGSMSSADFTKLAGIVGTNTGDNSPNSLYSGLVSNATHTGDVTGATILTLATVNADVGSFGSATSTSTFTVNEKGLVTAAGSTIITPAWSSITSKPTTLTGYGITDAASSTHVHGNISNTGAIGSTANLPIITTGGGVLTVGTFGSGANTFCQGNDARLSDARTPTTHNQAWSTITATPTTRSGYGITDAAANGAVTGTGITMSTARLLGRSTAATGAIEEIILGTNLSFTGTTLNAAGGAGVSTVTGSAPIVSSGGATPAISITAASGSVPGSMSSADFTKLSGITAGATVNAPDAQLRDRSTHTGTQTATTISDFAASSRTQVEAALVAGTAIVLTPTGSGATRVIDIAVSPATTSLAGYMSAADKVKLDGAVTAVNGSTPIVSSGGATPSISINPATTLVAGSMSAADKIKLDGAVTQVSGTGCIQSTGAPTPIISILAATTSVPGSMSAADKTKLNGIADSATANATDTALRDRSTHTGTQLAATISDFVASSRAQIEATLTAGTNITLTPSGSGATRSIQINAAGGAGVSTVTGTAPIVSSGGATPAISINAATGSTAGSMSAADFTKLAAITGTNTGDNSPNSLYSGLVSNATHTGDASGATVLTLATVNSNVGSFGSATSTSTFTVNAKGLVTAAGNTTITPAIGSVTGLGTGIATALAINTGTAGAPVLLNSAGGTPSSLILTNATGLPLTTGVTGLLPTASGGTGTATPALIPGTNVTITGSWPNQTINASGGGGGADAANAYLTVIFNAS